MPKRERQRPTVRERVQVYLDADDRDLLNRLAEETGLAKAEILRRGMRSFAREQQGGSPMLRFVAESTDSGWPDEVAANHDDVLAKAYRARPRKPR